jgi:hypothetical protein
MYQLLDQSNRIDREDEKASTELRDAIISLMKELSTYRQLLFKKSQQQRTVVINRLEDLQENLADFEYQVLFRYPAFLFRYSERDRSPPSSAGRKG